MYFRSDEPADDVPAAVRQRENDPAWNLFSRAASLAMMRRQLPAPCLYWPHKWTTVQRVAWRAAAAQDYANPDLRCSRTRRTEPGTKGPLSRALVEIHLRRSLHVAVGHLSGESLEQVFGGCHPLRTGGRARR